MISLNDKVWMRIDVGNLEDIITPEDNLILTIIEQAGNNIPSGMLSINLPVELQEYLSHEFTKITISLGYNEDNPVISRWEVSSFRKEATGILRIGLSLNRDYINVQGFKSYPQMSSIDVIKKAVSEYFDIDTDLSNFNDKMTWIQNGISCRDFIDDVWLHSYKDGSLMVPLITGNLKSEKTDRLGTFKIIDLCDYKDKVIEIRRDDKDGTRDEDGKPEKDIILYGEGDYSSSSGLMNYVIGNRGLTQFDISSSENKSEFVKLKPVFNGLYNAAFKHGVTMSKQPETEDLSFSEVNLPTRFTSDNVHKNYHRAAKWNLNRLSKFDGSHKMINIIDKRDHSITIGDFIRLHSFVPGSATMSEVVSGDYFVDGTITRVINRVDYKGYVKTLSLRRDTVDVMEYDGLFTNNITT